MKIGKKDALVLFHRDEDFRLIINEFRRGNPQSPYNEFLDLTDEVVDKYNSIENKPRFSTFIMEHPELLVMSDRYGKFHNRKGLYDSFQLGSLYGRSGYTPEYFKVNSAKAHDISEKIAWRKIDRRGYYTVMDIKDIELTQTRQEDLAVAQWDYTMGITRYHRSGVNANLTKEYLDKFRDREEYVRYCSNLAAYYFIDATDKYDNPKVVSCKTSVIPKKSYYIEFYDRFLKDRMNEEDTRIARVIFCSY